MSEWGIVKDLSELSDRLFWEDVISPVEAPGNGNVSLALSSVHSVQPNLWSGLSLLSSSNYMFLLCFYLCHFLLFLLFFSIVASSTAVPFPLLLTQTTVVLPNVLWSRGKFLECQWWAGAEGLGEQRHSLLAVCHPGNHRSWTGKLCATSHGIHQNGLVLTSIKQLDLIFKFRHLGTTVLISITFSFSDCSRAIK